MNEEGVGKSVNRTAEEQLMMAYLLGDLPEQEKARVEERIFADDEFYEQIAALKAELADGYARGELTARERERFENRFLNSAQGRERLAFARTMARAFGESGAAEISAPITASIEESSWRRSILTFFSARNPALQFSMAAAISLLLLGGLWLFWQNRSLQSQIEQARAEEDRWRRQAAGRQTRSDELAAQLERERAEREKLQNELDQARTEPAPSSKLAFVSFLLSPGLIRDRDEPEKLVIPRAARQIRLQLDTAGDDDYRSFRAELRTARGNLVWSQDQLSTQSTDTGAAVPLILPAGVLSAGEYELALRGVDSSGQSKDIGYYYFIILKK